MAAYENAMCHTRVHVLTCVNVRVCMNNEIVLFSGFSPSHYEDISHIT